MIRMDLMVDRTQVTNLAAFIGSLKPLVAGSSPARVTLGERPAER
jgi:hypothetical protein